MHDSGPPDLVGKLLKMAEPQADEDQAVADPRLVMLRVTHTQVVVVKVGVAALMLQQLVVMVVVWVNVGTRMIGYLDPTAQLTLVSGFLVLQALLVLAYAYIWYRAEELIRAYL